ncbi:MAG: hypothetical protein R3268_09325 [Acidiferrobacterales bacterium]|nr:hypothetical protein [Acidiferrobacterales bacterium]
MLLFIYRAFLCVFFLISYAAVFATSTTTSTTESLDGLQFKGETGEQGKGDHHEDTITFKDGQFRSVDCENWGFGSAPYSVEQQGDSYHFSATLLSPDRGKLEWKGTITGDTAKATFRWLHERWYWNIDRQYWFKGTRYTRP